MFKKQDPENKFYFQHGHKWPLYQSTRRPVTHMLDFSSEGDLLPGHLYLPVVRYPGLYYSKEKGEYCGKFFYFEPESSVLLDLGRTAIFASKLQAHHILGRAILAIDNERDFSQKDAVVISMKRFARRLPNWDSFRVDVGVWPWQIDWIDAQKRKGFSNEEMEECMRVFYYSIIENPSSIPEVSCLETTPLYPTDHNPWQRAPSVGIYDGFDQPICKQARYLGLDTVILQHQPGEYRAVTEILDTRDDAYNYLVRTTNDTGSWFPNHNKKYNTIWFPSYGFVSEDVTGKHNFTINEGDLHRVEIDF